MRPACNRGPCSLISALKVTGTGRWTCGGGAAAVLAGQAAPVLDVSGFLPAVLTFLLALMLTLRQVSKRGGQAVAALTQAQTKLDAALAQPGPPADLVAKFDALQTNLASLLPSWVKSELTVAQTKDALKNANPGLVAAALDRLYDALLAQVQALDPRLLETDLAALFTPLDDLPLATSKHILITALARDQQTGARYSADGKTLESVGTAPLLLEPVQATIRLTGARPTQVTPCDHYGVPFPRQAAIADDGSYTIDGSHRAYYYEVKR